MDNPLDSLLRCERTAQRQSDGGRGDQSRQCWLPDFGDGAPASLSSSKSFLDDPSTDDEES